MKILKKYFNVILNYQFPFRITILNRIFKSNNSLFGLGINIKNIHNLKIGNYVLLNDNFSILGNGKVNIRDYVYIAPNVTILTNTHNIENMDEVIKDVFIDELCWIGANVVILPGVTIGKGVIVGAGSVVSKNLEEYGIYVGNPIRFIRKRKISYPYRLPGGHKYLIVEKNTDSY